jgi:hypothetical protein
VSTIITSDVVVRAAVYTTHVCRACHCTCADTVSPAYGSVYRAGRVNVVELHDVVNVDVTVVEATVAAMIKSDGQLTLVQGDLIDRLVCSL